MHKVFIIEYPEVQDWPNKGDVYSKEYYTSYRNMKKGFETFKHEIEHAYPFKTKEDAEESAKEIISFFGKNYSDYEIKEVDQILINRKC